MKQIITFLVFITFISCKEEDSPKGELQELGLATTEIISEAQDSLFIVNIENPYWYLYKTEDIIGEKFTIIENSFYWKKNNGNTFQAYHDTIAGDWFEVAKDTSNIMIIKLKENKTQYDRKLRLYITGDEIKPDILTVIQKSID